MTSKSTSQLVAQFKAARLTSTPILWVRTADPAATVMLLANTANHDKAKAPVFQWDYVRGLLPANDLAAPISAKLASSPDALANPIEMLNAIHKLPASSIVFMLNAHLFLKDGGRTNAGVMQAVWNLRDEFKTNYRTLVMLSTVIDMPAELENDTTVLDEPLPDAEELREIVEHVFEGAEMEFPDAATMAKIVDALSGLCAFAAEQVTAMSLTKTGIDLVALWDRKRQMIEQTPGLKVWKGDETFDSIGGCESVKADITDLINGKASPRVFVWIDEIEKALAGVSGDTSGVSMDQLGAMLGYMQDEGATGVILVGHPGTGKSLIAKAAGATAGVPTIRLDLGAMKGSLVGESEARLRQALKVITAVGQGNAFFIATSNALGVVPTELRRRYKVGVYMFDLPTAEEREGIWSVMLKRFDLDANQPRPDDEGWTGAEIEQCCDLAWRLGRSLVDAAKRVVPISQSAPEKIEKLRAEAHNRYLSAHDASRYQSPTATADVPEVMVGKGRRAIGKA